MRARRGVDGVRKITLMVADAGAVDPWAIADAIACLDDRMRAVAIEERGYRVAIVGRRPWPRPSRADAMVATCPPAALYASRLLKAGGLAVVGRCTVEAAELPGIILPSDELMLNTLKRRAGMLIVEEVGRAHALAWCVGAVSAIMEIGVEPLGAKAGLDERGLAAARDAYERLRRRLASASES